MSQSAESSSRRRLSKYKIETPEKSIGFFGSIVLMVNNTSGPAMMSLPHLFIQAGYIPTIFTIVVVCMASSLCGTFLADSIAFIPGNRQFQRCIDFPSAFYVIAGDVWYTLAQILFLISCMVQACAALVETSQSLDSFLASFILGKTYAIELYPNTLQMISWSHEDCRKNELYGSVEPSHIHRFGSTVQLEFRENCTSPFSGAGPLVLSLGFLLTAILFMPMGIGNLKETMGLQILSFAFLILLLVQFCVVFIDQGLSSKNLPAFGNDWSQLTGVILFNFAFSITVPSWLSEKKDSVSVNKAIWLSITFTGVLYLSFGILAAMAINSVEGNVLVTLSSHKVNIFTRVCAALFSVSIIGCSVPVFCIIIKNTLYSSGLLSAPVSLLCGSVLPYLLSWTLYQGEALVNMLNWTGLVVNGIVAFVFPLLLASFTLKRRNRYREEYELLLSSKNKTETVRHHRHQGRFSQQIISSIRHFIYILSTFSWPEAHYYRLHSSNPVELEELEMLSKNETQGYGSDSSNDATDSEGDEDIPTNQNIAKPSIKPLQNSNTEIINDVDIESSYDEDTQYEDRLRHHHYLDAGLKDEEEERSPLRRIERNSLTDEQKLEQRLLTLKRRLSSVVAPLPEYFQPYFGIIVYVLIFGFSVAISATIFIDLLG